MIPQELIDLNQWVCWKWELVDNTKSTKPPYNARTGYKASPTNPYDWCDFNTAVNAVNSGIYDFTGIGFVLTENDPYCMIDLDYSQDNFVVQKQMQIANAFDTYQEISPSGKGLRIICRASVHNGRRKGKIELYSNQRYMTITGNTYKNQPIKDCNFLANILWTELGEEEKQINPEVLSQPEQYSDEVIYNVACTAENGSKFIDLYSGNWTKHYSSQSEADLALINIIGFYSRNIGQIRRIYLQSDLAQRDKAQKRKAYVEQMIIKSFDNHIPMIPLNEAIIKLAQELAEKRKPKTPIEISRQENVNPWLGPLFDNVPDSSYDWTQPPGLLGEISNFIYNSSVRPIKEIALGGAIALMSGICGRSYNVSNTGLNQYILMIAGTGIGKEGARGGINKIVQTISKTVAGIHEFIGPAALSSAPAIQKYLGKHPCFLSIIGEFGIVLKAIHAQNAKPTTTDIGRALLDLYNQSGKNDVLGSIIYSDKEKNTEPIKAPSFTILGESTPQTFYRSIDDLMISSGLLPRIMSIEYTGGRPERNDNHHNHEMPAKLISELEQLVRNCLVMQEQNRFIDVDFKSKVGDIELAYDRQCTKLINSSDNTITRELWSRAYVKVLKLSSLIAIGENMYNPVITKEGFEWARQLVERDILNILQKFEKGLAGNEVGELHQNELVINAIAKFLGNSHTAVEVYGVKAELHKDKIVPYSFLQRLTVSNNAFKNDRAGATNALHRTIMTLINDGSIREVGKSDLAAKYNTHMRAYLVTDVNRFL